MSANRISFTISPEQRQAAAAGIAQLASALPGLVAIEPSEIRELHHFVGKNETFGRGMYRVLEAHPLIVPPSLDVAAARADIEAIDALRPLLDAVQRLHTQLEHTLALLGHDAMDFAYEGYQQLKLSGAAHGLEEVRRELGQQFANRGRRRQEAPQPA
ncbi:hypothetical protein [Lysobacter fragariae]